MQRKENVNDTLKAVLQKHWTMLIQAVRQLAQAVGNRPPESEEVAAFFHDFMDGYYDDVKPIDAGQQGERMDLEMLKKTALMLVGALGVILLAVVFMTLL